MSSNDEVVHDTLLTKRKRSEDSISNDCPPPSSKKAKNKNDKERKVSRELQIARNQLAKAQELCNKLEEEKRKCRDRIDTLAHELEKRGIEIIEEKNTIEQKKKRNTTVRKDIWDKFQERFKKHLHNVMEFPKKSSNGIVTQTCEVPKVPATVGRRINNLDEDNTFKYDEEELLTLFPSSVLQKDNDDGDSMSVISMEGEYDTKAKVLFIEFSYKCEYK